MILDPAQVGLECAANRFEQRLAGAAELTAFDIVHGDVGKAVGQVSRTTHCLHDRVVRVRACNVIKLVLQQLQREGARGGFFAFIDDALEDPVELTEQQFDGNAGLQAFFSQRHHQRLGGIEQTPHARDARLARHVFNHVANLAQAQLGVDIAIPVEQPTMVVRSLLAQQFRQGRVAAAQHHLFAENHRIELGCEQRDFRDQRRIARGTQVVHQRQQDQRNIRLAAFDALQIGRQLHHAHHQDFDGGFLARDFLVADRRGQHLELVAQHGAAVNLHHVERTPHLMQIGHAPLQRIDLFLDVVLKLQARLAQGLVEFASNPAQRAVILCRVRRHVFVLVANASSNQASADIGISSSGSLKRATVLRSSSDICASISMDCEVCPVPSEV